MGSSPSWRVGRAIASAAFGPDGRTRTLASYSRCAPGDGPVRSPAVPPAPPPTDAALRLLGALQEEGRLVDFLEEDLSPYPDDQIGAAVRTIHEGCRKALRERIAVEPVLRGAEGETVTVEAGFDP